MNKIICFDCGKTALLRHSKGKIGRPWKRQFCNRKCYDNFRRKRHLELKRKLLILIRSIWGTTGLKQFQCKNSKIIGRAAEVRAKKYLKKEGFTIIADMCEMSNQFYIDFICFKNGERVLVDATVKIKAYIPHKTFLAGVLNMDLYIIHVAPKTEGLYHINKIDNSKTISRVPSKLIRSLQKKKT